MGSHALQTFMLTREPGDEAPGQMESQGKEAEKVVRVVKKKRKKRPLEGT
jgi:hypothetical protein